jgi:hypothetical protein
VLRDASDLLLDDEPTVLADLLRHLEERSDDPAETRNSAAWLAHRLETFTDRHERKRVPLADLMGLAARGLAPAGDPPSDDAGAAAWRATLATAERLYGEGFCRLGRLPFLDDGRLAMLLAESEQAQRATIGRAAQIGEPGRALRELAVDRRLTAGVSEAVDFAVRPSYRAVYMYYAPSARVHPHVDHADYEIIFHLTLAHIPPADGSRRAALVVYRLDGPPARVELAEGEAMVLRGRGSIHTREPIKGGEHWTTLAIGFAPEPVAERNSSGRSGRG